METINVVDTCPVGSSFHGIAFEATMKQIKTIFGNPKHNGTEKDKVQYEWFIKVDDDICSIYDWKEYKIINEDDSIIWHIGGYNSVTEQKLKKYIENKI